MRVRICRWRPDSSSTYRDTNQSQLSRQRLPLRSLLDKQAFSKAKTYLEPLIRGVRQPAKRILMIATAAIAAIALGTAIAELHPFRPLAGTASPAPYSNRFDESTLRVECFCDFRSPDFSISVDDDLAYEGKLGRESEGGFKLFKKRSSGRLFRALHVPAGRHVVEVRIKSEGRIFDERKSIEGYFVKDGEKTLEITFERRNGELHLSWRD